MDKYAEIKQYIRKIVASESSPTTKMPVFLAKVVQVHDETCDVEIDETDVVLTDVNLRAVEDGNDSKIVIKPAVGSYVQVLDKSGEFTDLLVLQYSQIERIEINCDNVVFNDGTLGMVLSDKLTNKLNDLENDLNALKTVFSNWAITPNDGGSALKVAATTWYGKSLTVTKKSELEDTKIVH
jgi:hypothetical protein